MASEIVENKAAAVTRNATPNHQQKRTVRILRNPRTKTFGFTLKVFEYSRAAGDVPTNRNCEASRPTAIIVSDTGESAVVAGALRAGDVIVAVNKLSAEGWTLAKVTEEVRKTKGDVVELEVRSSSTRVPAATGGSSAKSQAATAGNSSAAFARPTTEAVAVNTTAAAAAHPHPAAFVWAPYMYGIPAVYAPPQAGMSMMQMVSAAGALPTATTPAATSRKRAKQNTPHRADKPAARAPTVAERAAASRKRAKQNRRDPVIKHGSTIILDEFDVPRIPITYDLQTSDREWYKSFQSLVKLRNSDLLKLRTNSKLDWVAIKDTDLSEWVSKQRGMYARRRSLLRGRKPDSAAVQSALAKIEMLNAINFVWLPPGKHSTVLGPISDAEWKSYYAQLFGYTSERGHCIVPGFTELGFWCGMQRAKRRGGTLDWTKVQALNALGFGWDGDEVSDWKGMRARLARFKAKYGDCLVMPPREVDGSGYQEEGTDKDDHGGYDEKEEEENDEEGKKDDAETAGKTQEDGEENWSDLWWWVQCQRIERKRTSGCLLTPSHVASLDELDFIWSSDLDAKWIRNFHELKAYSAEHGTFHVPVAKKLPHLKLFVRNMRKKSELLKRYEEKERLKEEQTTSGSAAAVKLPVRDWRGYCTNICRLTPTAIRLLDSIGFCWVTENPNRGKGSQVATWEEKFEELRRYKERMGDCLVHQKDPSLGEWVKKQRTMYANYQQGKPSCNVEERIQKLEELGFLWRIRGKRGKGCQREETLKEARKAYKIARDNRRSMNGEAAGTGSSGAAMHEGNVSENEDEGSVREPPTQGKANQIEDRKRKLELSKEAPVSPDAAEQGENERGGIVDTLKCRVCSNIVVRSTLCLPCGHSFCAPCIEASDRMICPGCRRTVSSLAPQRDMDEVVTLLMQRGDFDTKDVAVHRRRLCELATTHSSATGVLI